MMNRSSILPAITLAAAYLLSPTWSSVEAGELMSSQTAARLGLEEVWRKQMSVPAGAASIVDQQLFAHASNPREYIEVVGKAPEGEEAPVLFRIAADQPDALGEPIGKEEAERLARREVRRLKRRIDEPTITSRITPRINLYTLANNGTIDCRDAESGSPIWMTQVGKQRLKYGKMGLDDKFLTLTNGGNVIKLDITNGEPIRTVRASSVPLYGAINAGDYAIVPTIRSGVEGYPLENISNHPFMEIVSGLALVPPIKSPDSTKIAWGTDRSFVYVMETSGTPNVQFRLATDGIVSGRIASASGDRFFFGSESGQVYALHATRSGEVLWSRPYGEPFFNAPFLFGDNVLLSSTYGSLYALDQETGHPVWDDVAPNVDQILGGLDDRIFVRLLTGSVAVLDAKTGATIDIDPGFMPVKLFVNRVSDRLYFVNNIGTVQCLRATDAVLPTLRNPVGEDPNAEETEESTKPVDKRLDPNVDPFNTDDPFGAGNADPFNAGGGEMADDPFGAGSTPAADDPFGGPAAGMDDPFGDPFGN